MKMLGLLLLCFSACMSSRVSPPPCQTAVFDSGEAWAVVQRSGYVKIITEEEEECKAGLRVVLIGGGGDTDTFIGHGGGSGFIKYEEVRSITLTEFT